MNRKLLASIVAARARAMSSSILSALNSFDKESAGCRFSSAGA